MAEQLSFPIAVKPALGRDDFFVSEANQMAVALLEDHTTWPQGKMVLVGPEGAGKTHLSHVWAGEVSATICLANALPTSDIDALAQGPVVVEDIDLIAGDMPAETGLFHLHNLAAANAQPLLMTTKSAPSRTEFHLKDLQSRMSAASIARIEPMDDALLTAMLMKLFADRQINIPSNLLSYILPRLPRNYASAQSFVSQLDETALREKRPIGIALAREIIARDLDIPPENTA